VLACTSDLSVSELATDKTLDIENTGEISLSQWSSDLEQITMTHTFAGFDGDLICGGITSHWRRTQRQSYSCSVQDNFNAADTGC
jgi:hypothetical protein